MLRLGAGIRLTLLLCLCFAATARADDKTSKPPALAALEKMVGNLGYATTDSSDNQAFSFSWAGKYNYTIHIDLSRDGTLAYTYVDLVTLTPEQIAKLQFVHLLEANDIGDFYFSMEKNGTGETLYANGIIPVQGLTPQSLRTTLSEYSDKIDGADNLWNTDLWK
jgi:hypothetical protein